MTLDSKYCLACEHSWTEHILGQPCPTNAEIAGRVMNPSSKAEWNSGTLHELAEEKWPGWAERQRLDSPATSPKERIVAAAIQIEGVTLSLPKPARHGQVLHSALNMHLPEDVVAGACQGFLTSRGRFVNRVQAKQIAHMAGQPQMRPESERTKDLYSEDLW